MKKVVIAIIGKSGVGKTTASLLFSQIDSRIQTLVSHTTRDKRKDEIDGIDHYFNDDPYLQSVDKDDIMASTVYGDSIYWSQYSDIKKDIFCYVVDEQGLRDLSEDDNLIIHTVLVVKNNTSNIDSNRTDRDKNRVFSNINSFDYIIRNDGSKEELKSKIENVVSKIIKLEETRQELLNKSIKKY